MAGVERTQTGRWRHRDFLLVWGGQAVSEAGSQVTVIALPLVAIDAMRVGTFAVGVLSACTSAAFLVAGLPAGALVDRLRKRRVMVLADIGRVLVLGSVPLAWWAGGLTLAQLYAVAIVAGLLTVFFDVAYQSFLPALVGAENLVGANGRLQATASAAQVGGPAAGGGLVSALGAAGAVAADAASFVVSVATLLLVRTEEHVAPVAAGRRSLRHDIAEGLRYVAKEPRIRSVAGATATSNFFSSLGEAVLLLFLRRQMHLSPAVIGLLFAGASVGGIAGALAASPMARRLGVGRTILSMIVLAGIGGLLFPLATRSDVVAVVIVGQFVVAFGAVAYNVNQVSMRQAICPPALLGRMNASVRTLVWGVMPLGALVGGALGAGVGLRATLWVAGVGGSCAFVWVAFSPGVRRVREMPTASPAVPAPDAPLPQLPAPVAAGD